MGVPRENVPLAHGLLRGAIFDRALDSGLRGPRIHVSQTGNPEGLTWRLVGVQPSQAGEICLAAGTCIPNTFPSLILEASPPGRATIGLERWAVVRRHESVQEGI